MVETKQIARGWPSFGIFIAVLLTSWSPEALAFVPTRPVQTSIVVDGVLDDWTGVLTNTRNTTFDGDGTDPTCLSSTDADCPTGQRHDDLASFSWTWDQDNWYFLADLQAPTNGRRYVYVYFDVNRDGRMGTGEPVLSLRFSDDSGGMDLERYPYVAVDPVAGDPMLDVQGQSDGYSLPGWVSGGPLVLAQDVGILPGASACEVAVPWSELGLSAGSAFDFHVASGKGTNLPADLRDNLGASDGGVGTTAWTEPTLAPPRSVAVAPGSTLDLQHEVRNEGNVDALVSLSAVSSISGDVTWLRDVDGDGVPETPIALDAQGDGLFTLPGDEIYPGNDADGNGRPDLALGPGEGVSIALRRDYPLGSNGLREELDLRIWAEESGAEQVTLTDRIAVGEVVIQADETRPAAPGDSAWFPHQLDNTTPVDQLVSFRSFSSRGWTVTLFEDTVGAGNPTDAVLIPDADADGKPDLTIPGASRRFLLARVEVPVATPVGTGDQTFVQAQVGGVSSGVVIDTAISEEPLRLRPDHLLANLDARHAGPGGTAWFAHRLDNARGQESRVSVSAMSDLGWSVELWSDPNANGRPEDAAPLVDPVFVLGPNGGTASLLVRVSVPQAASVGDLSRVSLTATAEDDSSIVAQADDDAVVSLIRVFDEPSHVVSVSRVAPCEEVHALASGLPPLNGQVRITWRTPDGTAVRVVDTATDGNGESVDTLSLQDSDPLGAWSVEIAVFDGMAWLVEDSTAFRVADGHAADPPLLASASLNLVGDRLDAETLVRSTVFDADEPVEVNWRVLSPDRSLLLDATGAFLPFDGLSWTRTESLVLAPLEERRLRLSVAGVAHASEGLHVVELHVDSSCGDAPGLVGQAEYEVLDDEDGDGVSRDDEIAAGTDPSDADSDDDGLLDGEDGLTDTDGDGLIDALDCDSDDDGLSDGLEAGRVVPHADTDVAAGCFVPDLDLFSTTDPDDPDSDGGGIPDGVEDADGNGRVDPDETDPETPADDYDPCCNSLVPREVLVLRAHRDGASGASVSWVPLGADDPCLSYAVLVSEDLPNFVDLATDLLYFQHVDTERASSGSLRAYLVVADSQVSGRGPSGLQ